MASDKLGRVDELVTPGHSHTTAQLWVTLGCIMALQRCTSVPHLMISLVNCVLWIAEQGYQLNEENAKCSYTLQCMGLVILFCMLQCTIN